MLRRELEYFLGAVRFFTRLPVPGWVGHSAEALGHAARWLPAVGLLVGLLGALVWWAASLLWAQPVALLLAMAAMLLTTGAFHEDGLADTADGLGGGWDKAKILAIMKDSRTGSYGVVALWLALTGKFVLLGQFATDLLPWALLAGQSVSRLMPAVLLATMDYARADDSSKSRPLTARLSPGGLAFAALFPAAACLWLPWPQALAGCVLAGLATWWLAAKLRRWLGGHTGDALGAVQQASELAFYLGLLVHWPA